MEIRPYERVGSLHFGMSPSETGEHLGAPQMVTKNRSKETVHRYPTILLTFDGGGLAEVGIPPEGKPTLHSLDPLTRAGFTRLLAEDGDAQETLGFVVLLNLGITVTGVHDDDASQLAVTAFRRGRWDGLREKMRPLSPWDGKVP